MSVTLSAEAQARLDRHLDAVEQALVAAGNSREHRRAVVDDLEAQIQEMLAAKSAMPTANDVETVLAQLDGPDAYGSASAMKEPQLAVEKDKEATKTTTHTTKRKTIMKSSIVVALVVCGTILVMTPAIADYMTQRNFVAYAASFASSTTLPHGLNINFDASPMEGVRRFGFWFTGSVAIAFGVIGGFVAFARERRHAQ